MRAPISPSLSSKSRLEAYFRTNSPIGMERTFLGVLLVRRALCRLDLRTSRALQPLSGTTEGNDCVWMLLSLTRKPIGTHGRLFDMRRQQNVLLRPCSIMALRASLHLPPLHAAHALEFALFLWRAHLCQNSEESEL